jgi:hypothetical protein
MPNKININKQQLIDLYINNPDATIPDIAKTLGVSRFTIMRAIKDYGLKSKPHGAKAETEMPQLNDKEWLAAELETKSFLQIAKENNTTVGRIADRAYRYGLRKPAKGKEAKSEAIKEAIKKRYPNGRYGKDTPNWRHGLTPLMRQIRASKEYKAWQMAIFARDFYSCVECGYKGQNIEADHYPESFVDIIVTRDIKTLEEALTSDDLWNIRNGRTLCEEHHRATDSYGARPKEAFDKIVNMTDEERQIEALYKRNHYLETRNSFLQGQYTEKLLENRRLKKEIKKLKIDNLE